MREALDSVRPYLESHGGDVELLGIEDGVARLRLRGLVQRLRGVAEHAGAGDRARAARRRRPTCSGSTSRASCAGAARAPAAARPT